VRDLRKKKKERASDEATQSTSPSPTTTATTSTSTTSSPVSQDTKAKKKRKKRKKNKKKRANNSGDQQMVLGWHQPSISGSGVFVITTYERRVRFLFPPSGRKPQGRFYATICFSTGILVMYGGMNSFSALSEADYSIHFMKNGIITSYCRIEELSLTDENRLGFKMSSLGECLVRSPYHHSGVGTR